MNESPAVREADPARRVSLRALWLLPIVAAVALVVLLRVAGFEYVFVDGDVVFPPADPQYHLRRGLQIFEGFPHVLLFDHYINYPGGAPIPWPPLFDVTMGVFPRLFGANEHGFETFAAWLSPICAVIATIPIVLVARRIAPERGPRVPALAVVIFAIVPLLVNVSRVGMADHHAAVSMIGAWMLLCCVVQVDAGLAGVRASLWTAVHVCVRLAMLCTWHGSLLYLVLAEASLALAYVWTGDRAIVRRQAIGAALTAVLLMPIVSVMPTPLGGSWSAIALSYLHVGAMAGVAILLALALIVDARVRLDSPAKRLGALAFGGICFVALLLLAPGSRSGIALAVEFMTMSDGVGPTTAEQLPLFDFGGRSSVNSFEMIWSWWAPLIPLAPVGVWLSARRFAVGSAARRGAWVVMLWCAVFGGLAIVQRRYGNEFGPSAAVSFAVGFAWLADEIAARVSRDRARPIVSTAIAVALVALTAWPALAHFHLPRLRSSRIALESPGRLELVTPRSVAATLTRFLKDVRRTTEETSGYFDRGGVPEYGVIAHPNLGHAIQYVARRPTATDPFWAYIGRENWARTQQVLTSVDEAEMLAVAESLRGRYVVTVRNLQPGTVLGRLHETDGSSQGRRPAFEHFRHVTEAPMGASAIGEIFAAQGRPIDPPYKLFEIVAGAELVFECDPRSTASASVRTLSPSGRSFEWKTWGRPDEFGRARLRVPWSTEPRDPALPRVTRSTGAFTVACGDSSWRVEVPESAVREGLEVDAAKPAAG